jgi:hypothetical protein
MEGKKIIPRAKFDNYVKYTRVMKRTIRRGEMKKLFIIITFLGSLNLYAQDLVLVSLVGGDDGGIGNIFISSVKEEIKKNPAVLLLDINHSDFGKSGKSAYIVMIQYSVISLPRCSPDVIYIYGANLIRYDITDKKLISVNFTIGHCNKKEIESMGQKLVKKFIVPGIKQYKK